MSRRFTIAAAAAFACFVAALSPAHAQRGVLDDGGDGAKRVPGRPDKEALLREFDENRDGKLDRGEVARMRKRIRERREAVKAAERRAAGAAAAGGAPGGFAAGHGAAGLAAGGGGGAGGAGAFFGGGAGVGGGPAPGGFAMGQRRGIVGLRPIPPWLRWMDVNGNGQIDLPEWLAAFDFDRNGRVDHMELQMIFDFNRNGVIDLEDQQRILRMWQEAIRNAGGVMGGGGGGGGFF